MIFCVEDDSNIRELVVYTLSSTGMEARGFESGDAMMKALSHEERPEMILLDIMLPGEDGLSILKKLKSTSKTREIPVIMVTAKGAEYDVVLGLDAGADDYVTKPFGMMELVSRVKAVLRRTKPIKSETYEVGILKLDLEKHKVIVSGEEVVLTLKEFELLYRLIQNKGIVLTRNRLLEEIWGFDFEGETRTLDVHIRSLRQKLGEAGEMVQTVRGVGYRLGGTHEE